MFRLRTRFHGTGNAWPVVLGEEHPFYDRYNYAQLANAAYSLLSEDEGKVEYEVLIDAGHGTIQSLLSTTNRIPEAVCLTHGHLDHTLSVDWIVQSYYRQHQKMSRYPVYSTRLVYEALCTSYPQLEEMIDHRELKYGIREPLEQTPIQVTAFPVYHGLKATGASMLLFEEAKSGKRILFTGDLLTPMIRRKDLAMLHNVDMAVCDANNRFPYPRSNHWSIQHAPAPSKDSFLDDFMEGMNPEKLQLPHRHISFHPSNEEFLEAFKMDYSPEGQPFVLLDFLRQINPMHTAVVHYSGSEDEKYYGQPRLSLQDLTTWMIAEGKKYLPHTTFHVPAAGDLIDIF